MLAGLEAEWDLGQKTASLTERPPPPTSPIQQVEVEFPAHWTLGIWRISGRSSIGDWIGVGSETSSQILLQLIKQPLNSSF